METFDEAPGTVQSPGVRADAQCSKITWLEELASERNTIQASEDITEAGRYKIAWKFGNLERGNISPGTDRWEVELQDVSGRLWRLVH